MRQACSKKAQHATPWQDSEGEHYTAQGSQTHLNGVSWGIQELGIKVEEGGLGETALVEAALVSAVHCEAQQVCMLTQTFVSQAADRRSHRGIPNASGPEAECQNNLGLMMPHARSCGISCWVQTLQHVTLYYQGGR